MLLNNALVLTLVMTNANGYKSTGYKEDRVRNCIKGHIQIEKNEDDEKTRVSCNKEVHRS